MLNKKHITKLFKKPYYCPICKQPCYVLDSDNLEYIKTKRKTEAFLSFKMFNERRKTWMSIS